MTQPAEMSASGVVEARLAERGLEVPAAPEVIGLYVPALLTRGMLVTSGQLPMVGKELAFKGKVGSDVTEEEGQFAARLCVLNALAQMKAVLGTLDRVKQIIRLDGFVQSAEGFSRQPAVINGASEVLVWAFGESGKHTRCAVGVNELPLGAAVEIAIWAEVTD